MSDAGIDFFTAWLCKLYIWFDYAIQFKASSLSFSLQGSKLN